MRQDKRVEVNVERVEHPSETACKQRAALGRRDLTRPKEPGLETGVRGDRCRFWRHSRRILVLNAGAFGLFFFPEPLETVESRRKNHGPAEQRAASNHDDRKPAP